MSVVVALHSEKGGVAKCLTGDAEITDPVTGRIRSLADVIGDSTFNGVHTLVDRHTIAAVALTVKVDSGIQSTLEVTLASGRTITATPHHPLLTPDGWRPVSEIQPGETIALAAQIPAPLQPSPLPAAEIDLLAVLLTEGCYTQPRGVTFSTGSADILDLTTRAAVQLGMTVKHSSRYDYRINGTGPNPAEVARGRGRCWCGCGKPTRPETSTWRAGGHQAGVPRKYARHCKPPSLLRRLLSRHGIGHELARAKRIPATIFQLPDDQLARFLAVFWMCDGCVSARGPEIVLASERMIRDVQHLLLRFGIQSTVSPQNSGAHWKVRVPSPWWPRFLDLIPIWGYKQHNLQKLVKGSRASGSIIGLPTFTDQLKLSLRAASDPDGFDGRVIATRYIARNKRTGQPSMADVAALLGWTKFQFDRLYNKGTGTICPAAFRAYCEAFGITEHDWLWSPGIFWDRVTTIAPAGEQQVYDLTVEPTHNFVASGVIVHNTSTVTGMAAAAGDRGIRVVVVDGDPRATATQELGIPDTSELLTLNDLLFVDPRNDDPPDPAEVIGEVLQHAGAEWPDTVRVICAERNLANREADSGPIEYRLRRALAALDDVDLVLCDLPPRAGGRLTTTLLTAADLVLFPATLQIDGYEGVREAHRTMRLIRQGPNPGLRELGIVRTIVPRPRDRRLIHEQIDRLLAETFPDRVLPTQIHQYAVREETRYAAWPITAATGRAAAALTAAYGALVDQVMEAA